MKPAAGQTARNDDAGGVVIDASRTRSLRVPEAHTINTCV